MTRLPNTAFHDNALLAHGKRTHNEGVVIHTIEGTDEGAEAWFKNRQANGIGAQVIIGQTTQVQTTDLDSVCWHCPGANQGWVGIEHEGFAAMTKAQWLKPANRRMLRASANRAAWICWHYKLGHPQHGKNVKGHADFPLPNTHHDPGAGWPWMFYMELCRKAYANLVDHGKWE